MGYLALTSQVRLQWQEPCHHSETLCSVLCSRRAAAHAGNVTAQLRDAIKALTKMAAELSLPVQMYRIGKVTCLGLAEMTYTINKYPLPLSHVYGTKNCF